MSKRNLKWAIREANDNIRDDVDVEVQSNANFQDHIWNWLI